MHFFVYIVRCVDGTLAIGVSTVHITTLIRDINAGKGSTYTRSRLPVFLAYYEEYMNEQDAKKRQAALKAMSRDAKEHLISIEHLKTLE